MPSRQPPVDNVQTTHAMPTGGPLNNGQASGSPSNVRTQADLSSALEPLLRTHAEKQSVTILKYDDRASVRRYNYQNWISGIKSVTKMFKETQAIIGEDSIHLYETLDCVGNQALFILVNSKVDKYFKQVLKRVENYGDKALQLLQTLCANITSGDRHHYNHQDQQLVEFFLAAISSTKDPSYMVNIATYQMKLDFNDSISFAEVERKFLASQRQSQLLIYHHF
mmetsp:Transcript_9593/g.13839  ORF Transcript_9593/g.13839 Transcript_9593/m.13839 type:complete len:224 (+) Transcript_9593:841-1512(+)